jgi:hypothetical protein
MDIPHDSAFFSSGASALLSPVSFHHAEAPGIQLLQYQKVQESIPLQGMSIALGGKREISRQKWEEMKPLIQRVYIRENKTFRQLKTVLREEYGVEPRYGSIHSYPVLQVSLPERKLMRNIVAVNFLGKSLNGGSGKTYLVVKDARYYRALITGPIHSRESRTHGSIWANYKIGKSGTKKRKGL